MRRYNNLRACGNSEYLLFFGSDDGKYAEHVTVILRIVYHMLLATTLCCLSIQVRPV